MRTQLIARSRPTWRSHEHPRRFGAATSVILVSGLVLAACTSEPEPDAAEAAAVLAEYEEARNAVEGDDPASLDALMSLYAQDAVVTGHPLDPSAPPIATGVEEIRALEEQVPVRGRDDYATEFFDVEASGDRASFHHHFFNVFGECSGGSEADAITVEDGLITRYEWGARADDACDPQRLAQTYDEGMTVEFTGDGCVYTGPTDFGAGDRFDVTAVDATADLSDVGYAIDKVVDGTTVAAVEQAQQEGGAEALIEEDSGTYLYSKWTQGERFMSTTLDVPGTWLLYCFLPDQGEQIYATTLEVAD
jgi:ketosteroid isomerase-like protein